MAHIPGLTIHDLDNRELLIYREQLESKRKQPLLAWLLWFFLGVFGGHRFYLGHTGIAVAMLLTLGGLGIWTLIDAFFIQKNLRQIETAVANAILSEIEMMRGRREQQD